MLTWDNFQSLFRSSTGDTNSTNLATFKMLGNLGYKEILHSFGGEETEDVRSWSPTADNVSDRIRAFKLPPNFIRINSVSGTIGGNTFPIYCEESQDRWALRVSTNQSGSRPTHYYIRPRFGVGGSEILFDPIPSSTDLVITINYSANARDLSVDAYTTGTIALTNGSSTLTGTGTTFTPAMVGRYFTVDDEAGDGMWYRITGYTSATVLTLENLYDGATVTGKNYKIAEAFYLPEDLQMAPFQYAMWYYYQGPRKDAKTAQTWQSAYLLTKKLAETNYKKKNKSATVNDGQQSALFPTAAPIYFPNSVTGS